MHAAAEGGNTGIAKLFAEKGVEIDAKTTCCAVIMGRPEIAKWLADRGADTGVTTKRKQTLPHTAAGNHGN